MLKHWGPSNGPNLQIECSVIGRNCEIGFDSVIRGSYIQDHVKVTLSPNSAAAFSFASLAFAAELSCARQIHEGVVITDSMICEGAVIKEGAIIEAGCIVGFKVPGFRCANQCYQ